MAFGTFRISPCFINKLNDLYAFFLSVKKYNEPTTQPDLKKRIRESFKDQPLRGGSSYVNMYTGLLSVQQLGDRLSVGKLYYASPGEVDVRGRLDIFSELAVSLSEFTASYDLLKQQYNELYKYLSEGKLLRAEPDRFDNNGPVAKFILDKARTFSKSLKLQDDQTIYELSGENTLIYAKILLSHFRRLEKYFMFFAEGRVKEPETIAAQ